MVAYVEKTYTVMESEGYVEVCVNLTHSEMDILDVAIRVESYNNNQSPSDTVVASESPVYSVIFMVYIIHFLQLLTLLTSLEGILWLH